MSADPRKHLLAIDTCGRRCAAGVFELYGGALSACAEASTPMERGHAEAIVPMVDCVMAEAGVAFTDLDRIAVTIGPGSFTGVRIGIAAARGFAVAHAIPVIGVGTLEAIADTVRRDSPGDGGPLAIALDARRGEVFLQSFAGNGTAFDEPLAVRPEDAASHIPQDCQRLAGSGAPIIQNGAAESGRDFEVVSNDVSPSLVSIAHLAFRRPVTENPPRPVYLRPPDAKPQNRTIKMASDG